MSNFTKKKLCHPIGISQSAHLWMTGIFTLLLLCLSGSKAKAADVPSTWKSVNFNDGIRYSQWVINSRISDFYGNQTQRGFNTYDASGNKISSSKGTQKFDYVPGLVAKAILEAYANYSTFDWSKPWFYSVMNYAKDNTYTLIAKEGATSFSGITLDNMNACKMYFPLMAADALSTDAKSKGETAIANVLTDMNKYNSMYVIGGSESGVASSTNETVKSMFGGWFHKPEYTDQMWCDGLYMGAALLAQIINYKNSTTNVDATNDWDLIAKQFTISWNQLYNSSKGLLYHAFTANPKDDASSAWSGISNTTGSEVYHSEAFWGRAMGWYFLALVDVLEQMPSDNKNRETLRGYLQNLASGLANYQDAETGCWYQVIDEKDNTLTGNYLESSCTCLFAAAYLKAVRLGLLSTDGKDYKTIGENAFKGAVNQFMKCDTFGPTGATVQLVHNCASAGLGGTANRSGSRDYYINGSDVGQTNTYTEGKVMGAFIMAATEYEKANPKSIRLSSDLAPSYSLTKGESIKVEALGEGTATYQWYDSQKAEAVATEASFTPEASGSYYCKITVTPTTSAKTRAASTETYDITTGVTVVTVSEESTSTDVLYVTTNGQTFDLTQSNITENAYASASTSNWTDKKIDGTSYSLYNMSNTNRKITLKVSGASSFEVKVQNSTSGRTYGINITDANSIPTTKTITHGGTGVESSGIINTTSTGEITIELSGGGDSVYPYQIIFYTGSTETSGYTISYSTSVGTAPESKSNITTLTSDELPTLSAEGYTFDGWYTDADFNNKATAGATISTNTTLYAKWTINKYTVTTAATNGSVSIVDGSNTEVTSDSEVEHGTKLVFTATPNSGYEFSSWTVNGTTGTANGATYTIESLDATTSVTANFTATTSGGGSSTTDIFTLHVTSTETISVESKKTIDAGSYATITGGSAELYNGSSSSKELVTGGQFNLNGSSGSYIKITLNQALQAGDEIVITPATSSFKLSNTDSNKNATEFTGSYVVTASDNFVGKSVIYLYKNSSSTITDIIISRPNPDADSRATFTYDGSQLSFTETAEGTYTTTIEIVASKRGESITITPSVQEGATIKEGETTVTSPITITAPSTTGDTTTKTYTVTSKDASTTTTYVINVTVVKEKITLVFSDTDDNTEWTWNSTTTPTQPTFNQPTVKAYKTDAEGNKTLLTDETLSYEYESDVTSVATVTEAGVISIVTSGNGGAKIYATLVDNDNYYADPTFFNVIIEQGYSFSVGASETAPEINTSEYITRTIEGETENLVKMTFGGWKWNNGEYAVKRASGTTNYTDKWNDSGTKASDIASIDGHYYWWNGQNDAVDESKASSKDEDGNEVQIYGSVRYGWFKSPEHDEDGKTTKSYPFSLPVRGSYMTFEPYMNGTLTIYILQNGAWNTNDNGGTKYGIEYAKGDIIPGEFRPHAFQVVNQRGLTVQEFSPNYSVSTKQKVDSRYYCMFTGDDDYDQTKYNDGHNVATWTEFKDYMSTAEQKRAHDNWNSGPLGAQEIIELDNGSFLAVQKGIVKYTFHVTGNETYYFFSNFSKMGFSGANFVPDEAQPVESADDGGKIHSLELSDVTKYEQITATENGTIEGTNLKNYNYSINGTDVAPVAGVSIPQFYSIKLTRTFKPNQWTTLTLPFNLTQEEVQKVFGDGTQLIMLNNATLINEGARLEFIYHEIQNVLPGYPYLIKPTLKSVTNDANVKVTTSNGNITSFTVYSKCINPFIKPFEVDTDPYTFKGTPDYCTADKTNNKNVSGYSVNYATNDIFVSEGDGKLYVSGGSSYGKGYRAWLKKKGTGETTSVKSISVVMSSFSDDDNTTTSIDVAEMAPDLLEALGIQTGVYNLNGQRVANDTRNLKAGIYLVNGKKTVVK
ncbi:MAG: glycoside hydrolase family 88 protein [Prevotella sp.]